jgi:hypothetical protein
MQVTISMEAAEVIGRAWATNPDLAMDELVTAMNGSLLYLVGQVRERTPTNQGHLRRSFDTKTTVFMDAVFGEVNNPLTYAMPVEMGTRPHFPPLEPLIDWVEAKLGLYGSDAEGAARGIQRKIGRFGTPGYGMARYALIDGQDTIRAEFDDAAERITLRLAQLGGSGASA